VAEAGVRVPPGRIVRSEAEVWQEDATPELPCFVKPRWEGSSKGIGIGSRADDRQALAAAVARVIRDYGQPALVERFLAGAEYTVTLIGNDPPRALPVLQRALETTTRIGLHAVEPKPGEPTPAGSRAAFSHVVPGTLAPALEAELVELAARAFRALECRDFARADFKCDDAGRPCFLEINPLPTFAPDGSFGIHAELLGRSLDDLLAEVLGEGLRRLGLC
jgi:D-alanine-D-alanine ligase